MGPALLALTVILSDDPQTWAIKARARLESAPGVHLVYSFKGGNQRQATITYDAARPLRQKVQFTSGNSVYQFLQSPRGAVLIDVKGKSYDEYQPVSVLLSMPPETEISDCLPPPLFSESNQFKQASKWKVVKAGNPAELSLDYQLMDGEVIKFKVTVDATGRMTQISSEQTVPNGVARSEWTLTGDDYRLTDQGSIEPDVPEGFTPDLFPQALMTISPSLTWPSLAVRSATSNGTVDLRKSGKPSVIVVTAPDCEISSQMSGVLDELGQKVSEAGASFAELSLSPNPPTRPSQSRPVGYDPDGSLARELRLPMTPYFIVLDAKGVMVKGFAGYHPDQKQNLFDTVLRALKPKKA